MNRRICQWVYMPNLFWIANELHCSIINIHVWEFNIWIFWCYLYNSFPPKHWSLDNQSNKINLTLTITIQKVFIKSNMWFPSKDVKIFGPSISIDVKRRKEISKIHTPRVRNHKRVKRKQFYQLSTSNTFALSTEQSLPRRLRAVSNATRAMRSI